MGHYQAVQNAVIQILNSDNAEIIRTWHKEIHYAGAFVDSRSCVEG